jgi:hypothetical protein
MDSLFLLYGISIGGILAAIIILGTVSFWRSKVSTGKTFRLFMEGSNTLKIVSIMMLIPSTVYLASTKIISSEATVSIISAMIGYVLGSLKNPERIADGDETESS